MNAHKNVRLTPHSWAVLVRRVLEDRQMPQNWSQASAQKSIADLRDRSSRSHKLRHPTPEYIIRRIETLRRQR